jgi:hypothetical protein
MALAYVVLAHRNPRQVARLVGRLSTSEDVVFVHIDRKVDIKPFREAFDRLPIPPTLLYPRVRVRWGTYDHVKATMVGIRAALRSKREFSHIILLTGQDYPIRATVDIQRFYADVVGRSFISWSAGTGRHIPDEERRGNAVWGWSGRTGRLLRWHLSVNGRHIELPKGPRRIPRGLVAHQGLAYWSLTPQAAAYCLRVVRRRPAVRWFFNFVFVPDESMFQMLLLASPLRETLVNEDLRFLNWDRFHPETLVAEDLESMRASAKLFARKFDDEVDSDVLDALDRDQPRSERV